MASLNTDGSRISQATNVIYVVKVDTKLVCNNTQTDQVTTRKDDTVFRPGSSGAY